MDDVTTFDEVKAAVREFCDERQWEQFHTPKNLAMAIAAEAGELLEPLMWLDGDESITAARQAPTRGQLVDELADVMILCTRLADVAEIDLAQAIQDKLAKNRQKYPASKARGSAKKYTDL